ncbi:MAG: pilus assembly protein PilM [Myxococcota bacterium]
MPMMKNVLGLDLGSHALKAVELRQTFRGVEPVQLRVQPRTDPEAPLDELLSRFIRLHQLPTEHVVCAIPGDRLSGRRLELPFRDHRKLKQAVPFEIEGKIPFALEDVLVDWEIVGGDRNHSVVAATLATRSEIARQLGELRAAQCEPRVLEAEGLVLGNLCALFDLPGSRLLVDIGHRKTTFCLLVDERPVAARTIAVGGAALTEAIARDRSLSAADAERAKCEEGLFRAGFETAAPGAVAVLDRIAREMLRTLEGLEPVLGGTASTQLSGITLFGGSARLHRLEEYLAERTGFATERLALPPESKGAALVAGGDPVLFAPALALALRATGETRTRIDFRQEEFAYRTDLRQLFGPELRKTGIWAGLAGLLLIVSVVTSITLQSRRATRLESEVQRLYSEVFPGEPAPERPLAMMREAVHAARERADFLGAYGGNRSALDLLAELSRRVPRDLEVKFEEVNIDRRVVRIKVFAKSFEAADRLTSELAREAPFTSAKVASEIKTDNKRGGQTFSLNISLDAPEDAT